MQNRSSSKGQPSSAVKRNTNNQHRQPSSTSAMKGEKASKRAANQIEEGHLARLASTTNDHHQRHDQTYAATQREPLHKPRKDKHKRSSKSQLRSNRHEQATQPVVMERALTPMQRVERLRTDFSELVNELHDGSEYKLIL